MKKTFVVRVATVATLAFTAVLAGGTTASAASAPSVVALSPLYATRALCVAAGDLGIQQGRWSYYSCVPQRVGVYMFYRLIPDPL
jgi:hypothetical protein